MEFVEYKICPKCNGKIANTRFECIHCGYIYSGYIKCPECGRYQEFGNQKCKSCGYSFTNGKQIGKINKDKKTKENANVVVEKKEERKKAILKKVYKIGDEFEYGAYYDEPILWRVLDIIDGKLLVISEYIIEARKFDEKTNNYDKSEIKKWLENDFKNESFDSDERTKIEKIYLLSKEEVEKYFKTDEKRKCKGTKHAIDNGLVDKFSGYSWWWARSNDSRGAVYYVSDHGWVGVTSDVNIGYYGVRAACVINL